MYKKKKQKFKFKKKIVIDIIYLKFEIGKNKLCMKIEIFTI